MQRHDIILDDRLPPQYREKSEVAKEVEHAMREAVDAMRDFMGKEPFDEDELDQPDWFVEDRKMPPYSREKDTELMRVLGVLNTENPREIRRAEVEDKYPEGEIPQKNYVMPEWNRDIVAELEEPIDLDVLGEAADQLGLSNRTLDYEELDWTPQLQVTFPHTEDPEAEGKTGVRYEEDESIYVVGGGLYRNHGNLGPEPFVEEGSLFYESGEPVERLALLDRYLDMVE